jgi:hypothetical protein
MSSIETRITIVSKASEPLTVLFEVINNGSQNLRILKRYTPLEGLKSDCLVVRVNGRKVRYDGYFFKRGQPDASSYQSLLAGEVVSRTVDVSKAYDTSLPGQYEVSFSKNRLLVLPEITLEKISFTFEKLVTKIAIATIGAVQARILSPLQLTVGAQNRLQLMSLEKAAAHEDPVVIGASEHQEKIILRAHRNGMQYVRKTVGMINDDDLYRIWFGEYNDSRPARAQSVYDKIINRRARFTYRVGGEDCAPDDYAYTTDGSSLIHLCRLFWAAEDEGLESRAGTIVHEHTHASAGTYDHDYMQIGCKELARDHPLKAVRNADNYEYFAEYLNLE